MWSCLTVCAGSLLLPFDSCILARATARRTAAHFGLDEVARWATEFHRNSLASGFSHFKVPCLLSVEIRCSLASSCAIQWFDHGS